MISDYLIRNGGCPHCGSKYGLVSDVEYSKPVYFVNCMGDGCGKFLYALPKSRLPIFPKQVDRHGRPFTQPALRKFVLAKTGSACIWCRSTDKPHLAHIISVADCVSYGMHWKFINDERNLTVLCHKCNGDLGKRSMVPVDIWADNPEIFNRINYGEDIVE